MAEVIEMPFALTTLVGPGKHLLHIADCFWWMLYHNNNSNSNNLACIAPVYQRLQRRWRTDYGRENWLGLNVWWNKNVLRVDLNTATEVLETTSLLSELQTVGAVQQKAHSTQYSLLVCLCVYLTFFLSYRSLLSSSFLMLSFFYLFTGLLLDLAIYFFQNRPVPFPGRRS